MRVVRQDYVVAREEYNVVLTCDTCDGEYYYSLFVNKRGKDFSNESVAVAYLHHIFLEYSYRYVGVVIRLS